MEPLLPDYRGACLANVVPALLGRDGALPGWLPAEVAAADQVVLLALDGLGWEQLHERAHLTPTLAGLTGGPISSVVPTTTATALSSLATGAPPAAHGVVGYRVQVAPGEVMNVLRWTTDAGDARERFLPADFALVPSFLGVMPPVVTRAEFRASGFTGAHLLPARIHGYRVTSTLVVEVNQLLAAGERFVYAYYDGADRVAHTFGLGAHFDAEIVALDRLVADVLAVLPPSAVLVVTSDHGQVLVGDQVVELDVDLMADVALLSGEGRFRWLHARPGAADRLAERARALYEGKAWVRTRDEAEAEGWFGGALPPAVAARLGDVVLAPFEPIAFLDPADTGEFSLVCRHGSMTSAEMLVPLLAGRG